MAASPARFDVYEAITNQIIAAIEQGADHSQMPWHRSGGSIEQPGHVASKCAYGGVNTGALLGIGSLPALQQRPVGQP